VAVPQQAATPVARVETPRRMGDYGGGVATPATLRRPGGTGGPGGPAKPDPATEGKRLTVGRDIAMSGTIGSCDVLTVEGRVEATMDGGKVMEIAESGVYVGRALVEVADIAGRFEGELIVRERLNVRATGKVGGTIRYAQIEIELGGEVSGTLVAGIDQTGSG
jgi:cytoskeletal protein CcmA (bactofilin family)